MCGAITLHEYGEHLASGEAPDETFNYQHMAFTPKGSDELDTDCEAIRDAASARPLSLKNTDNKSIAGTYNLCVTPAVQKCVSYIQNGFIKGRQLVGNIVTIDTTGRL